MKRIFIFVVGLVLFIVGCSMICSVFYPMSRFDQIYDFLIIIKDIYIIILGFILISSGIMLFLIEFDV